jgi:MYXO-CTERM domain-containing protein
MGMTGLQIDSMRFGDANRDRKVDMADLLLWQQAAGVPEPGSGMLAILGAVVSGALRRRRTAG